MKIESPYLMFLGDAQDELAAKTASGIVHWRRDRCFGQIKLPGCNADLSLPDASIMEAVDRGCKTLVIGVANRGGVVPDSWIPTLLHALESGLDIAAGLHQKLDDIEDLSRAAQINGRQLFDVRHPTQTFNVGSGKGRSGKRLLTVGTDCSVGKMYTALALEQAMISENMKCDFRASGQTGIFIANSGVCIDAVVSDFISGATEWLSPKNDDDHWDLIEGQGSLSHPSYAGVTMGLVHGAQPHALVMCHEQTRTHMRGLPHQRMPDLLKCIELHTHAARLTNPECECIGLAVNTSNIENEDKRIECLQNISNLTGLPAVDPVKDGVFELIKNFI